MAAFLPVFDLRKNGYLECKVLGNADLDYKVLGLKDQIKYRRNTCNQVAT